MVRTQTRIPNETRFWQHNFILRWHRGCDRFIEEGAIEKGVIDKIICCSLGSVYCKRDIVM